jgi:manganese/iron transport system permease protein
VSFITDPLVLPFFQKAVLASAIVGLVCAIVGSFVVLRGLAFMGDALSHSTFAGIVAAYMIKAPFYLGASIAAVVTALGVGWLTRQGRVRGDTAIGVLFVSMFALGLLLYSTIRTYVGDLNGFILGQALWVSFSDLVSLSILAAIVIGTVALLWKELLFATFDPLGAAASGLRVGLLDYLLLALIALTIVISLQAVGIILVLAMLITPAATAQLISKSFGRLVLIAALIGIVSPVIGLYLSFWFNTGSGATAVLVESAVFGIVLAGTTLDSKYRHPAPVGAGDHHHHHHLH